MTTFAHPNQLIAAADLEPMLADDGLRVFDCTTYLLYGSGTCKPYTVTPGSPDEFAGAADRTIETLTSSRPAQGFDRVRLHGGNAAEKMRDNQANGIFIRDEEWQMVLEVAKIARPRVSSVMAYIYMTYIYMSHAPMRSTPTVTCTGTP